MTALARWIALGQDVPGVSGTARACAPSTGGSPSGWSIRKAESHRPFGQPKTRKREPSSRSVREGPSPGRDVRSTATLAIIPLVAVTVPRPLLTGNGNHLPRTGALFGIHPGSSPSSAPGNRGESGKPVGGPQLGSAHPPDGKGREFRDTILL